MGNFNRGSRSGGGRGFERRGFNDRSSRSPVDMHQAICGKCGKDCEVPFRPTNDRPVFCSSCFENNRSSDIRPANFEEKRMFEAICDECGNHCQVPFQPSNGKPIYCSNCFGEKRGARSTESRQVQPQYKEQFEQLNNKLNKILIMLAPTEDVKEPQSEEQSANIEKKIKVAKNKPSKKK